MGDQRDGVVLNHWHRVGVTNFYDVELCRYTDAFLAAADIGHGDAVLDIGCGAGQTTRLAAAASGTGAVLGVDVSSARLELARERGVEEGLGNVSFVEADAQTYAFPRAEFDVAISRFGTMFFTDHISAFRNIAGALRPGARFVQLVWQRPERNEWNIELQEALTPGRTAPTPGPTMNPFALADAGVTEAMLLAAGFSEVHCVDLREPICYGQDSVIACAAVRGLHSVRAVLDAMGAEEVADALLRLRRTLAAHQRPDGVWFNARAWLIVATRPSVLP
ncbi:MAG TPA: methyltransferase domain-containing protein [Pseudonocardiaceae bacterium]|nr:methyltransferase domain-containing protein [Pseudonocardiaceae bacterium]